MYMVIYYMGQYVNKSIKVQEKKLRVWSMKLWTWTCHWKRKKGGRVSLYSCWWGKNIFRKKNEISFVLPSRLRQRALNMCENRLSIQFISNIAWEPTNIYIEILPLLSFISKFAKINFFSSKFADSVYIISNLFDQVVNHSPVEAIVRLNLKGISLSISITCIKRQSKIHFTNKRCICT